MKRLLIILALCGSVMAQDDPFHHLEEERRVIAARIEDVDAQVDFHRRKELYFHGVIAGVEKWDGGDAYAEMAQHRRKRWYFEDLRHELYYADSEVVDRLRKAGAGY